MIIDEKLINELEQLQIEKKKKKISTSKLS